MIKTRIEMPSVSGDPSPARLMPPNLRRDLPFVEFHTKHRHDARKYPLNAFETNNGGISKWHLDSGRSAPRER